MKSIQAQLLSTAALLPVPSTFRSAGILLVSVLFISGCSGSSESLPDSGVAQNDDTTIPEVSQENTTVAVSPTPATSDATTPETATVAPTTGVILEDSESTGIENNTSAASSDGANDEEADSAVTFPDFVVSDTFEQSTTEIEFAITVPAIQSDALQLGLSWGDINAAAAWVVDESWIITGVFASDTENLLVITFYDDNGATTLGTVEQMFRTGSNATESVQISASQFDTDRWDDDNDGISNIDELLTQASPLLEESPLAIAPDAPDEDIGNRSSFDLLDVSQDLIETLAGQQLEWLIPVVDDFAYIVEQLRPIQWPDDAWYQVQNVESFRTSAGFIPPTYATMCEGVSECLIIPGEYEVTNHTTGERSSLQISYVDPADNPRTIQLPGDSVTLGDDVLAPTTTNVERRQYMCELGGDLIVEESTTSAAFLDGRTNSAGSIRRLEYIFNQCEMRINDGLLPAGNYLLDGAMLTDLRGYAGFDAAEHRNRVAYDGFNVIGDNGYEYHVDGEVEVFSYFAGFGRRTEITEYRKVVPDGFASESMFDVEMDIASRALNANGVLRNSQTGNQEVYVTSNPALLQQIRLVGSEYELVIPHQGAIEMRAEDGSFLHLRANPVRIDDRWGAPRRLVDLDYTTANGEQILETEIDLLPAGRNAAENCGFGRVARSPVTQRFMCMGSFSLVFGRQFTIP